MQTDRLADIGLDWQTGGSETSRKTLESETDMGCQTDRRRTLPSRVSNKEKVELKKKRMRRTEEGGGIAAILSCDC